MRHKQVPDNPLESFGMGSNVGGVYSGNDDADVGHLRGKASITAHDADDLGANGTRVFQRGYQVWAYLLFEIASSHREHENGILLFQTAHAQPFFEGGGPTFVIGSGCQFGNIVSWRVGFESDNFAEVVNGVRGIGSAA